MIDYYTGTPVQEGGPKYYEAPDLAAMQLNTLTLERNAVLIVRIPKDGGYDLQDFESLKRIFEGTFPNHAVLFMYNDIELMAIEDKGYKAERIEVNATQNYY